MIAALSSPAQPGGPETSDSAAVANRLHHYRTMIQSSAYETTDSEDDSEWTLHNSTSEPERKQEARAQEVEWLQQAEGEARWQWDMFAKVPRWSYTNPVRTRCSLLSQLLKPDPNAFPLDHPYRRSFSSQNMLFSQQSHGAFTLQQTRKSSVALPQAVAVVAQAPRTDGVHASSVKARDLAHSKKDRSHSIDLEEYSDSEDEHSDNSIQVSRSLAQQKLAALADSNRQRHSDRERVPPEPPIRPQLPCVATVPIPLSHPYNLPAPAAPMTPRTTRRQMLSTELSESLRRNLLWERQVSRNTVLGRRRNGLLSNGLRPLAAVHDLARQNGGPSNSSEDEDERSRKRRISRTHGWADDYHYAGW